jgi:hypothetical protein
VNDKLTVVVFANLAQANPTRIAHGVAAIYNAELAPLPPVAIKDNEPEVTALARKIWEQAEAGLLQSDLFEPAAWVEISRNAAASKELIKSLGPIKSVELLERTEQNDRRLYRYRLTFVDTSLNYNMILTKEGKIAGLRIQLQ